MTTNNPYLIDSTTESLVKFFAKATECPDEEIYLARHECTLARYALRDKMTFYTSLRSLINHSINSEKPEEALVHLSRLDIHAEKLICTVEKLVKILKSAAEIEIISNSKFDSVQLFHLVQQIPILISNLITDMATTLLTTFAEDLILVARQQLSQSLNGDSHKLKILDDILTQARLEIPVLAASFAKEITDKLSLDLQSNLQVLQAGAAVGGVKLPT